MEDLGFLGMLKSYQQILCRTYNYPSNLDNISKEFIKELQKPSNLFNTPKAIISMAIFREG